MGGSIMVDWEIEQAIEKGRLVIDPYRPELLQPNSIDVTLGDEFTWSSSFNPVNPVDQNSVLEGVTHKVMDKIRIDPGWFLLGATAEKFSLPDNIVGQLTGKSSLARLGLMVHVTAGFIDAGFSVPPSTITLELYNCSNRQIVLHAGMAIGQMVFTETAHCRIPYNLKKSSKYNGQKPADTSRYYMNQNPKEWIDDVDDDTVSVEYALTESESE